MAATSWGLMGPWAERTEDQVHSISARREVLPAAGDIRGVAFVASGAGVLRSAHLEVGRWWRGR